jgi:hypothetical protein
VAALASYGLAREMRASRSGAFVAGAVYALGGFALACVNLHWFLQALALAPLVTLLLLRAATRGGRWIPAAGLGLAVALTTAQEFVAQAVVLGVALGLSTPRGSLRRRACALAVAVGVGLAICAVPVSVVAGVLSETVRGRGLPVRNILDYSVHPAVFLQTLIRDFFGSLSSPLELWWGARFFTKGFPYFMSVYLGPHVLALAACGILVLAPRRRWILIGLALLGVWYALGAWGGLSSTLASWGIVRSYRFPSKALMLPYLIMPVLVARGWDRLARGAGWTIYLRASGALGGLALSLFVLEWAWPNAFSDWMGVDARMSPVVASHLRPECLGVALLALLGTAAAAGVLRGVIPAGRAALLVAVLLIADLLRASAGVNPQTASNFYDLLPGTAAALSNLDGGRVFTYGTEISPTFREYLDRGHGGLLIAYFVKRQTLAPYSNLLNRVETVPADDIAWFVFRAPEIALAEYDPQLIDNILPRLRNSAVSRILSLDPLTHPDLRLVSFVPTGLPMLNLHIYELRDTWARAYVACRVQVTRTQNEAWSRVFEPDFDPATDVALERPGAATCTTGRAHRLDTYPGYDAYEVELDGPGYFVTRDNFAKGWKAWVGSTPAEVVRGNGKNRAVALSAGRHQVVFRYEPPGLTRGLVGLALGVFAALGLWVRPVLRGERDEPGATHGIRTNA